MVTAQTRTIRKPRLRHVLVVQTRTRTPDGAGGWSEAWSDVGQIHAHVEPVRMRERYTAQKIEAGVTYRVLTRYRTDIRPEDTRLLYGTRVLDVRGVADPDGTRRWLLIEATEGVG